MRGSSLVTLIAAAAVLAGADRLACAAVDPGVATPPRMEFAPPAPGTYVLQKIQTIAEATLFDPESRPTRLSAVTTSKITLLTFFYTYCPDPLGCPFAYHVLTEIRGTLQRDPTLAGNVRFVGISLDPTTDTPEAIGRYRDMVTRSSTFEWRFLTAGSVRDLLPVLDDFGQDVSVEIAADGTARRTLHHMLKLFLIDSRGNVREIYTLAYLHPQVIVNDIRTLYLEQDRDTSRMSAQH
jgi:cytochrome oxidase Cu insertion factor (SCO1/SenC/PrrC family)